MFSVEDLVAIMGKLSNNFTKITPDDFDDDSSNKNESALLDNNKYKGKAWDYEN